MGKRLKAGDVLEVATSDGRFVYMQYLGKHAEYGDAVAVCPREHESRAPENASLFVSAYVTFYPASAAVARGLARVCGACAPQPMPVKWRRPGAIEGLTVKTWIIEDGSSQEVKQRLSLEERHLPIAAIWNHEFLLQRVREGWRPEMEGGT